MALGEVEVSKAKEEHLKKIMKENREIESDIASLRQISKTCYPPFLTPFSSNSCSIWPGDMLTKLHCPHKDLDDEMRQLLNQLTRQLTERQNSDTQQYILDLVINTADGQETISMVFCNSERRVQWEETFAEVKQKLMKAEDRRSPPDFLSLIPIRKTRSGLQFTSAAPSLSINSHRLRDVWVCNSDGYVGQVRVCFFIFSHV